MAGQRTRNQTKVLQLLQSLEQAISAQDLHYKLKQQHESMGLATIYRALDALKLEGIVQVKILGNGESVYSSTQTDRHHLTCLNCGHSIAIDECPVHDVEHKLHDDYRFKTYYHTLEFYGLCKTCQLTQTPATSDS
ncbi:MAG: Fur family transcriptional regulator [Cyanobacteria bacterium P01_H01_bin.121]